MKSNHPNKLALIVISSLFLISSNTSISEVSSNKQNIAIVIHGGAGNLTKKSISEKQQTLYKEKLKEALLAGHKVLNQGGSSLDAVEFVITMLEDSPLFNAGKGAVYTHEKTHELDASIMDGKTLAAGAVAGVKTVKNPITLARAVMEKSKHVMMSGQGAEMFAQEHGIKQVENHYFNTPKRLKNLKDAKQRELKRLNSSSASSSSLNHYKFGTVGAVALDQHGNLAAGTSTGGMTNKRYGRIGDSPIIGAGTYANNQSCAVSATGHGEYFIRYVVAHTICALQEFKQMTLADSAKTVIQETLLKAGGEGGIIAMDAKGNIVTEFNTSGMFRGYIDKHGKMEIGIFE